MFLAGGTGATLRIWLATIIDRRLGESLPYVGTLGVNLLGCLAIGLGAAALPVGVVRPIVLGGLLGGFTTYSAFGLLGWRLLEDGRHGTFAIQLGLHIVVGIACVWLGLTVGRAFVPQDAAGS